MNKVLGNKAAIAFFILPPLILYSVLVVFPVLWSFYYSFYNGTPGLKWEFNGINNYIKLLSDKNFLTSLWVNVRYIAIVMLGQVGLGLLLALMFLFWLKRFKSIIRTLVFFPVVLPTVAVGQLFSKIYEIQPNYGLLNSLLDNIGLDIYIQPWIGQASTALYCLSAMDIWVAMGFYSVIYYGALLDIPTEVLEAASIDGCHGWQLFKQILFPLLRPVTITCLIFSFTGTVKMFESALALTGGGPGNATKSMSMYMYNVSFTYGNMGYGSVIAIFIFVLCFMGAKLIRSFDRKEI